jgi:glycogen(starch) synthase
LATNLFEEVERVTACSRDTLQRIVALHPSVATRASVTLNAVPAPDIGPSPLPAVPSLLVLSRFGREKGVDVALRAFRLLNDDYPSLKMVVAGDGRERAFLKSLGNEKVTFVGEVGRAQVSELIANSTLVVVPSREEGFGLVALEAAWMGRTVVASRVGGLPEVVEHNETGLLVPPDNPEALAEAILTLLDSPEQLVEYGRAAHLRASRDFRWNDCINRYLSVYREFSH